MTGPAGDGFPPDSPVATEVLPSPNHGERREGRRPELLVLHYTGMESGGAALARLRDSAAEVSAHYLVWEDGRVTQLVPESRRAWHAGGEPWAGAPDVNSRSVGIEIVNAGHPGGLPPYPAAQIAAAIALCQDVVGRHAIRPWHVLAHSDVAPERKEDPGERFPWAALAAAGVGHWVEPAASAIPSAALGPGAAGAEVAALQAALAAYGYDCPASGLYDARTEAVVRALQRRFRPARLDGVADRETVAILEALAADRTARS